MYISEENGIIHIDGRGSLCFRIPGPTDYALEINNLSSRCIINNWNICTVSTGGRLREWWYCSKILWRWMGSAKKV